VTRLQTGRLGFVSQEGRGMDRFSSSQRPDRLWGPCSYQFTGYSRLSPRGQSCWGAKLITHFHLVLKFKTRGAISSLPQ